MNDTIVSVSMPDRDSVLSRIDSELGHLLQIRSAILGERIGIAPLVILAIALIFNIWGFSIHATMYMVIWISASLYFYLFYPMLPMVLFPFRYLTKQKEKTNKEHKKESLLRWARELQVFHNLRVGFRLFMRFFIMSLLPLTIGMICIYLVSIIYSVYLGNTGLIPADTSELISIQCAGIILFYIEIFFFRQKLFNFAAYVRKQTVLEWKKLLILSVLGFVLLIVGTVVVLLLLIAILLPGFTLSSFINVAEFVKVKSNVWVFIIFVTQIIIMQFLQSVLSLRISLKMADDLIERLKSARNYVVSDIHALKPVDGGGDGSDLMKDPLMVLKETELYAFNRRQMFGLFPTYSVGVNVPGLFKIKTLSELKEVFVGGN